MKVCNKCKIEKPFFEFTKNKNTKSGFHNSCTICKNINANKNKLKNKEKYIQSVYEYSNSEQGFLRKRIGQIFTKRNIERAGTPNIDRKNQKEIEKYFYEYVEKYGRNCFYCFEPWTYTVTKVEIGIGKHVKKRGKNNNKNLSFDRLDNDKPYGINNIVFCCQRCNLSKNEVSIKLIKRLHEIITERNL